MIEVEPYCNENETGTMLDLAAVQLSTLKKEVEKYCKEERE